jgi:hypothetical protein
MKKAREYLSPRSQSVESVGKGVFKFSHSLSTLPCRSIGLLCDASINTGTHHVSMLAGAKPCCTSGKNSRAVRGPNSPERAADTPPCEEADHHQILSGISIVGPLAPRTCCAPLAQSAERTTFNRVVVGSSPTGGEIFFLSARQSLFLTNASVATSDAIFCLLLALPGV